MTDLLTPERATPTKPLMRYLPRLCRWQVLVGGVTIAWALTWWRTGDVIDEVGAMWLLRLVVVVGCLAAVFALDDPSRNMTEPLVETRRSLVVGRLTVAIGVVAVAMLPAVLAVGGRLSSAVAWGLALEAIGVLSLLCGLSLTLQRRWRITEPAQYLALSVLLIGVADQVTAGRWPLLAGPGEQWADAHVRWAVLAVAAVAVVGWQLRDPASPALTRGRRRGAGVASRRDHATP
jgi:hypothetical protein